MAHEAPGTPMFYVYIVVIVGLVLFAGLMSGLTLGLMSLSLVDLEVLQKSGSDADKKHAGKILPVVRKQHLLLCTLLIGNALAMEALPIFLDSLVEAWGAILISVTLILLFGEIIPQAICSRYGLAVGSAMSPVVRILLMVFFPISYPISKLLDAILGKGHGSLFRRAELKTLVDLHGDEAGKGGELTHDETTIIAGALELTEKTAEEAMTPIESVFALDVNAKLNLETMQNIMARGHSRIPVYAGDKNNIIGLVLVKNLLTVLPLDEKPVRECTIRKIPRVPEDAPLYDILNDFQKGHSHMAVVVKYNKKKADISRRTRESLKERRSLSSRRSSKRHPDTMTCRNIESQNSTVTLEIPEEDGAPVTTDTGSCNGPVQIGNGEYEHASKIPMRVLSGSVSPFVTAPVMRLDEGGGDQLIPQKSKKWVNSGDRNVLELRDGTVPEFGNDEVVVGIITMEDLIEELLQEEILDETDEYVDIHNNIKVNPMSKSGRSPTSVPLGTGLISAVSPLAASNLMPMPASPASSVQSPLNVTPVNSASPWTSPSVSPLSTSMPRT